MAVVVSTEDYLSIVGRIKGFSGSDEDLENSIKFDYGLPVITIRSLIAQIFKRRMRFTHFRIKNQAADIWYRYQIAVHHGEPQGIIIRLSNELASSPCLVAKVILEQFLKSKINPKRSPADTSLSPKKQASSDCSEVEDSDRKSVVSLGNMLRDTTLIPDGRLSYEILLCTLYDTKYGSITELGNRLVGEEYECRLVREATKHGLSFQSEKDLRSQGYDKTPDLKLNVPIAVGGFVVNWIESKALFGNPDEHRGYIKDQYSSYWNRFGPGLVIYWFGHVDSIEDPQEKRFIVRGDFPNDITYTKPLSIAPSRSQEPTFS